jgi:glycosyltransferase involved in cell wall biosynthesis
VARGAWVHTPSAYVGAEVRSLFGVAEERLRVIPHGPPLPAGVTPSATTPAGSGQPYVLALGTREPRKNLPRLVEAYGLVHAQHPDVGLVLVGQEGPDQPNVRVAIDRLPSAAAGTVTVSDWVSDERRAELLAGAAVLAVPSLDEGFSLPLLEAMQLGVPIVAADAGAIPEVAAGAALLVDPHDAPAIAAALLTALTDAVTRARLVAAGQARVADFSWARTAASFAALYREAAMERDRT